MNVSGKKMMMVFLAGSVFTVGAVAVAMMTGVLTRTSPVVSPDVSISSQPTSITKTPVVHKKMSTKVRAPESQLASAETAPSLPPPPPCGNCGVIEAINAVVERGQASGGGAVTGGLLGAVLGHQVGQGRGKDLATVAGAVGGAMAGNALEKNANKVTRYRVGVRMGDGTSQLFTFNTAPSLAIGDHVKVVEGGLVRD